MASIIPLRDLSRGQAQIVALTGHPGYMHRLEEVGLVPGKSVQIIRPGTSCIFKIDGNRLCFRPSELLDVLVSQ